MALTTKNKIDFINGTIAQPPKFDDPLFVAWTRRNNMILSWILNSISKEIYSNIIYTTSAYEMWADLKEQLSKWNSPRIFHLQSAISSSSQDRLFISVFYTRLKALWDELHNYCLFLNFTCGTLSTLILYQQKSCAFNFWWD